MLLASRVSDETHQVNNEPRPCPNTRGAAAKSALNGGRAWRRFLPAIALACAALSTVTTPARAQLPEGVSLGLTPTAERVFWNDDLTLAGSWYLGGRASLNFGRFVALQGYYLQGHKVEAQGVGELSDARRWGGDVVFTFADWSLTPSVRAGAGVAEFDAPGSGDNEILTGSFAAGLRFDLFRRLQTQVYVQDVVFRASGASPLVDPDRVTGDENETFHNLALGAGINLYLGGQDRQPETDRAFEGGVHGVASPFELYGGELHFDDVLGIESLTVAGARAGIDFGPYVGLAGYYFGSVEGDLGGFTEYFGYGAEGRFNLDRSDRAFTPFLVFGAGRLHFPEAVATAAALDDNKKWHAVLGGGLGFNLSERVRLDAAARDFLMSRSDPESVNAPDQLRHNWLLTGGIRVALGGRAGGTLIAADAPEPVPGPSEPDSARVGADGPLTAADAETSELARELRAVRAALDSLRREVRGEEAALQPPADSAPVAARAGVAGSPSTVEIPVIEGGEIYIRFGDSRDSRRLEGVPGEGAAVDAPNERIEQLPTRAQIAPGSAAADSLQAVIRELRAAVQALRAGEVAADAPFAADADSVRQLLDRLETQLRTEEALRREAEERRRVEELRRDERRESQLDERVEALRADVARLERALRERGEPERVLVEVEDAEVLEVRTTRPRGVLRGDPLGIRGVSPYAGASLHEPEQLLLGVQTDIGSAFGGATRIVPELTFGISDDFTWNVNAHIEWPVPFRLGEARPYVGGGLGILRNGGTEFLLPNIVAGLTYPLGDLQAFGTLQGLDFFDYTRVVFGLHLPPPAFLRSQEPGTTTALIGQAPERAPIEPIAPPALEEDTEPVENRPPPESPEATGTPEPSGIAVRTGIPKPSEASTPRVTFERGEPEEPSAPEVPGHALLDALAELRGVPAVLDVRATEGGATVALGGAWIFPSGSSSLSQDARSTLGPLADILVARPGVRLIVEGHTDSQGPAALNERLSRQRAENVRAALIDLGVASRRISTAWYASDRPVADNSTSEGRARNRRVEVVLIGQN